MIFPVTLVAGARARLVTTAMVPQSSRVGPSRPECTHEFALSHSLTIIRDQGTRGGNVLYTPML